MKWKGQNSGLTVPSLGLLWTEYKEQDREWYFSLGTILRKVRTGKGAWGWKEGKAYEGWAHYPAGHPLEHDRDTQRDHADYSSFRLSVCLWEGKTKKHLSFPSFHSPFLAGLSLPHGALISIYYLSLFDTELFLVTTGAACVPRALAWPMCRSHDPALYVGFLNLHPQSQGSTSHARAMPTSQVHAYTGQCRN